MAIHSRWRLRAGQAGVRFPAAKSVGASDNETMAMTEKKWLACEDPSKMLGKASDRKLRLFGCACCRRIWYLHTDERSRKAVELSERFADGVAHDGVTRSKLQAAHLEADEAYDEAYKQVGTPNSPRTDAAASAVQVSTITLDPTEDHDCANTCAYAYVHAAQAVAAPAESGGSYDTNLWNMELVHQTNLLRCIIGNPFRPITLNPAWRLTPTVKQLARSIYDERAFDRLPILADALEDAGCDNADILNHCRQPGEHVRGCWVVDLCLGKE
jgi:hypothetical protein